MALIERFGVVGLRPQASASRRALASAAVAAAGAAGAAPACAAEATTCVVSTARSSSAYRVPDCAPFTAKAKPRRRRSGGARALGGGDDGFGGGGFGSGGGGDDARWWGEGAPQQPESGDDGLLWHTLCALSLLAGAQHAFTRASVRSASVQRER